MRRYTQTTGSLLTCSCITPAAVPSDPQSPCWNTTHLLQLHLRVVLQLLLPRRQPAGPFCLCCCQAPGGLRLHLPLHRHQLPLQPLQGGVEGVV